MAEQRHRATDVAHVALRLGRLMLANGADAALVQMEVALLAQRLGFEAQILVHSEGVLLTLQDQDSFITKLGHVVSGTTVNMGALTLLDQIVKSASIASLPVGEINERIDTVERSANRYPTWLIAIGLGVTAASLTRLFGAAWIVVGASACTGIASLLLRQCFARWSINPIASSAMVAFVSGLVGAVLLKAFPGTPPTLCLVAAGMILVPGVPLLNGVREALGSHVTTGLSRLMVGIVTVLAITFGLFLAAGVAGDALPVDAPVVLLPVSQDLLFSAFAAVGYALLFNVPARDAWGCIVCGMAGHGLRTALGHMGVDLVIASMPSAFAAAAIARYLGARLRVPAVIFAFPGVVAMVPGSYGFRAGVGGLGIMHSGPAASPALIGDTIGLAVTATLMTASIAIGVSLALATPFAIMTRLFTGGKQP